MSNYQNPIVPGFYPDPSICRVGEEYYMVHSSFAYFPGIPVFGSRNLSDWTQIGHVLERNSQIPLSGCGHSEGIYAPTIRYHEGKYYVITTNVSGGGNFLVTADHPSGPWSEPYYLGDGAKGIDPSLFFDEDGSCYYIGQRENSAGGRYFGDCEIWIQKLDLNTMRLVGEAKAVLYGFQNHAVWPEGPHLYKKDGYYYLLHAESGTERNHCIVVARSRNIRGPYEYCPANPILTHRHLGKNYPVTCAGHGDLVEDEYGNWYIVMLACRPEKGYTLMGRETFLAKVVWEDGWPVINPGIGKLEECGALWNSGEKSMFRSDPPGGKNCNIQRLYRFESGKLPPEMVMLRNPGMGQYSLSERQGCLRLFMKSATLREKESPAYVGVRQQHRSCQSEIVLEPHFSGETDCAGMALLQNEDNQIRMECYEERGQRRIRLMVCIRGEEKRKADQRMEDTGGIRLRISIEGLEAAFFWKSEKEQEDVPWRTLAEKVDLRFLSTEEAGGFTGCTMGMYASGGGKKSSGYADFLQFSYRCGGFVPT